MTTSAVEKATPESTSVAEQAHDQNWYVPAVDIAENADEILVVASMPGVVQKDIDITFEKGILRISGRVAASGPAPESYLVREFAPSGYERSFRIGDAIDVDKIHADYANGVLTLHLPRAESAKPRSIAVTAR